MCSSVADPSDGPRDPAPLLFLAPDEVQRDEKKIFKTPPTLSEGLDPPQLLLLIYLSTL